MRFTRSLLAAMVLLIGSGCLCAQAVTYSLVNDWSDTSNPNGAWAYYGGTSLLPAQADLAPLFGGLPFTQPGFAPSTDLSATPGFLPLIFKAAGTVSGLSYNVGDVVLHTSGGPDSNPAYGLGNIIFTSPIAGIADISGTIHPVRAIGRPTSWQAFVPVALGPFAAGSFDGTTAQLAPESFDFPNVSLSVGEEFEFFTGALALGDLLDVSLTVNFAETVPEPGSLVVFATGLLGLAMMRKRRGSRRVG
jgi:hypothetical protein